MTGRVAAVVVGIAASVLVGVLLLVVLMTRAPTQDPRATAPEGKDRVADVVSVIAHRGASAYAPHNTLAAAGEAVRRGADLLEADLRQTSDGHLVALFHGSLAPTTDVERIFPGREPWRVETFTLAEVRRLDAGSWFGPQFAGQKVPTLTDMLEVLDGTDVGLIVEPKTPSRYPGLAETLDEIIRAEPLRFAEVESFDEAFLRGFARRGLPVDIGLTGTPDVRRLADIGTFADAVNPRLADIDQAYVRQAREVGLEVKVWSLNDERSMRTAIAMGVDGIYTHRPDLLRGMLEP